MFPLKEERGKYGLHATEANCKQIR